jgi:hypothetical protein
MAYWQSFHNHNRRERVYSTSCAPFNQIKNWLSCRYKYLSQPWTTLEEDYIVMQGLVNKLSFLSVVDSSVGRALSLSHEGPRFNLGADICSFGYWSVI